MKLLLYLVSHCGELVVANDDIIYLKGVIYHVLSQLASLAAGLKLRKWYLGHSTLFSMLELG